jgi:transcription elongation factor Elf1
MQNPFQTENQGDSGLTHLKKKVKCLKCGKEFRTNPKFDKRHIENLLCSICCKKWFEYHSKWCRSINPYKLFETYLKWKEEKEIVKVILI